MKYTLRIGSCALWSVLLIVGCGDGGEFPVAATSGQVLCEGQPVAHVTVFFEPLQTGTAALVGKQGLGTTDANGNFSISTYGERDGAVVGQHRVRVGAGNPDTYGKVECDCVLNSEIDVLQVEVKQGVDNKFQVALKKRTGRERPSLEALEAAEEARQAAALAR